MKSQAETKTFYSYTNNYTIIQIDDTMIKGKIKKWGNSLGIIIPNEAVKELKLHENQEIGIEIINMDNPLKELFGWGKDKKITRKEFEENRESLESKYD